ncbi:MAG: MMPL family transporter [Pseudomonadota bacterium]
MRSVLNSFYRSCILRYDLLFLLLWVAVIIACAIQLPNFRLDASSDSLLLENDQDLAIYRDIHERYPNSDSFLIVAYKTKATSDSIFDAPYINDLTNLTNGLSKVAGIKAVRSILNVPVLNHPDLELTNVKEHSETLAQQLNEFDNSDQKQRVMRKAQQSMLKNPVYRNLLISEDGTTTAIQLVLDEEENIDSLIQERDKFNRMLLDKKQLKDSPQTKEWQQKKDNLDREIQRARDLSVEQQGKIIAQVREILSNHRAQADLFLGGVPMIVVDMIDYVKSDVLTFGIGVFVLLIITLAVLFRRIHWMVISLITCIVICLMVAGFLAWTYFPVTVISSNFASLLFIINLSMIIHLIVRFEELSQSGMINAHPSERLYETMRQMAMPCFYATLTTVVGFFSLYLSDIRPIIDFGLMMSWGSAFSFIIAFVFFPLVVQLFIRVRPQLFNPTPVIAEKIIQQKSTFSKSNFINHSFAVITDKLGDKIIYISLVLGAISIYGMMQLSVENRFIDYFKDDSEIHQGMLLIDQQLGGTTPLEITVTFPDLTAVEANSEEDCFISDECLDDVIGDTELLSQERVQLIQSIHAELEKIPAMGKVLSLDTTLKLLQQVNGDKTLNSAELALLESVFPKDLRGLLLDPYVNFDHNELRFSLRVKDSEPGLVRADLIADIKSLLSEKFKLAPENYQVAGMLVLYNNMLQSLFSSQISTLGASLLVIGIMFMMLFRSWKIAILGIIPNIFSTGLVLGLMGLMNIPLDLMTITIAAVGVGIAVDNTSHYIYRFEEELRKDRNPLAAMYRTHDSIGKAIYFTGVTIILGFSILMFSHFNPTIYFGFFTGLAMAVSMVTTFTLAPWLLVKFSNWAFPIKN